MAAESIDFAVINASQVVRVGEGAGGPRRGTEQGKLDVIDYGALVASQGKIVAVGPSAAITRDYDLSRAQVIDATGRVVLPGLVDAHTHPLFAGSRYAEYAERLGGLEREQVQARGGGIWWSVQRTRAASDEALTQALTGYMQQILAQGTTTVEVKSGYGQTTQEELRHLRIIGQVAASAAVRMVPTFLGAHILPGEFSDGQSYTEEIVNEMLPRVKAQGIARFCDTTCNARAFPPELAARIMRAAADLGLGNRVHADGGEVTGGWETAVRNRAASADHLTALSRAQIEQVGPTDTVAVLLPAAELYYLWPRADARAFIDTGVPVAIATDFCSSIHVPSLFQVMAMAAPWFRMTPDEVIAAVTVNAAYSLGMLGSVGTLDPGKRADLLIAHVPHYQQLVFEFTVPLIDVVVVDGKVWVDHTRDARGF